MAEISDEVAAATDLSEALGSMSVFLWWQIADIQARINPLISPFRLHFDASPILSARD